MSRKSFLKEMRVSVAGECSICGDMLLTPPLPIDRDGCQKAKEALEELFSRHIGLKHSRLHEATTSL